MIDKTKLNIAGDIALYGLSKDNAPQAVKEAYDKCWNILLYKYIRDPLSGSYYVPIRQFGLFLGNSNLRRLLYLLVEDGVEYEGTSVLKDSIFITKENLEDFVRVKYDEGKSAFVLVKKRK